MSEPQAGFQPVPPPAPFPGPSQPAPTQLNESNQFTLYQLPNAASEQQYPTSYGAMEMSRDALPAVPISPKSGMFDRVGPMIAVIVACVVGVGLTFMLRSEGGTSVDADGVVVVQPVPGYVGEYSYQDWRGSDFSGMDLSTADFTSSDLRNAAFTASELTAATFTEADLRAADMTKTSAVGATFEDADMRGTDLSDSILHGANLERADLRGATIAGADLTGASLKDADMSGVRYSDATVWPAGFPIPADAVKI